VRCLRAVALALAVAVAPAARAARPFITDDAAVVGARQVQLETFLRIDRNATQHWALLGVGAAAPLELTVGFFHGASHPREAPATEYGSAGPLLQAKVLLSEVRLNSWPGLALAAGAFVPLGRGRFEPAGWSGFAYAAVTASLFDQDRLLLHANVGVFAADAEPENQVTLTWGVGAQVRLFAGLHALAEIFSGDPYAGSCACAVQGGLRYILSPNLQLDATGGTGIFGAHTLPGWATVGVRLVSDPIGR
jgi:hypothetical protein